MSATDTENDQTRTKLVGFIMTFAIITILIGFVFVGYQIVQLIVNGPNVWRFLFLGFSALPFIQLRMKQTKPVFIFFKALDTTFELLVIWYSAYNLTHGGTFWDILFGLTFAATFAINAKSGFSDDALGLKKLSKTKKSQGNQNG